MCIILGDHCEFGKIRESFGLSEKNVESFVLSSKKENGIYKTDSATKKKSDQSNGRESQVSQKNFAQQSFERLEDCIEQIKSLCIEIDKVNAL